MTNRHALPSNTETHTIFGQFGGSFCGTTTRAIHQGERVNGRVRVRVVRRVRERRCVVPQAVQTTLEVTFRAAPKLT